MSTVLYEKKGHIAYITINRPKAMNCINSETWMAMNEIWQDFKKDFELYVAILTGAGNKAFCAGWDLKEMLKEPIHIPWKTIEESRELAWNGPGFGGITRGMEIWKPIIAAINGYCIAGGNEIALACDIRIAADHAEFGHQEVRWCMMPGDGGCQRLPRVIGLGRALELILTGERISAQEAYRIGLVNKVVSAEQLMFEATKLAETICQHSQLAVHACKEAITRGIGTPLREGLAYENLLLQQLFTTEDRLEGSRAFAERREPHWKNR
ncbi:MAG: enoyl-CoA hydratase/isomerase family protein [Chloroflexi bacterium]|nr:enoyl-CoA hydratase/isomerase family protein [Chloroflexota bacterium]